ncbi:MAG TPA: glycosyltransferase family 9 protein [Candidatus Limnocylindrales bacterium]|nr:glycosyltransferase family 9 protein [Candidatus Limnocylindrales bacterium]
MPPEQRLPPLDAGALRRILAVRLDNVGDLVLLGPALRALREAAPRATIDLLCSPVGAEATPLLPWVDRTIPHRALWQDAAGRLPFDPARELGLVEALRAGHYDAAFVFTSFSQSPYPAAYAAYLAGIPVRVAQTRDFGGAVLSHPVVPLPDPTHQADRNLHLLEAVGIPVTDRRLELAVPPESAARARAFLAEAGIGPDDPFVVLAPGASCAARRYPVDRFAAVAAGLAGALDWPIVVVGADRERPLAAPVLEATPLARSLVGRTDVPELAAVVARARLVVTSHSAPLHVADAFAVPVVCPFSGTDLESQWRPRRSPAALLRVPTRCAPCGRFECPFAMECLELPPGAVVEAALDLLEVSRSPAGGARVPRAASEPRKDRWIASAS